MERPPRFVPGDEPFPEPWDADLAERLVGQYALVGMAWAADGEERVAQYHGRIRSADRDAGIEIVCEGRFAGETLVLPPATGWFGSARPGEYRLKTTGEVVVNPDVLTTWRIETPEPRAEERDS